MTPATGLNESGAPPGTRHDESFDDALKGLHVDRTHGVSESGSDERRAKHGPNELVDRQTRDALAILKEQFKSPLVWVLLGAAVASAFLGDAIEVVAILAIVVLNAALGFFQEYRAETALASLRKLSEPHATVLRGGQWVRVTASLIVPGDIVQLEAGNRVPADGRLIETAHLQINEASLTGESMPVEKQTDPLPTETLLAERTNSVYMGTIVSAGRGVAAVTATGMNTELGHIAGMLQSADKEITPLQKRLAKLSLELTWAGVAIIALIMAAGFLRGDSLREVVMTALSMAVAVIPEGLPAAVTVVLALGTRRMLERQAMIRRLSAIETLGSVTVICTDKTGTLTVGRMSLSSAIVDGELLETTDLSSLSDDHCRKLMPLLTIATLCNDAPAESDRANGSGKQGDAIEAAGDPTEVAIVDGAKLLGLDVAAERSRLPRVEELSFDSDRKRMSTVHERNGIDDQHALHVLARGAKDGVQQHLICTKGSLESLLSVCRASWTAGGSEPITEATRKAWMQRHDALAQKGARVLAVAFDVRTVDLSAESEPSAIERDLILLGLLGLSDPPRPEAREAVARCYKAGIRPLMMTGDHPLTAASIAEQIGIQNTVEPQTGAMLSTLSDEEFSQTVVRATVYARVAPADKLRIVKSLQKRGEIVAMTGDGVNDAPALQQSTVGIAMGKGGTDVARDASDVVLLDDNFASIVAAVAEGRIIFGNILRFLKFLLASNSGELWVMGIALMLGMPLPLLPLQILWINLVTDGFPALGLAFERSDRRAMDRPPRPPDKPLIDRQALIEILGIGLLMGIVSLAAGGTWDPGPADEARWRTMIFSVLTLSQLGNALALRSSTEPIWRLGLFTNPLLLTSVVVTSGLQLAVVYVPFLQRIFGTTTLSAREMILCPVLGAVVFAVLEIRKILPLGTPSPPAEN